MGRSLLLACCIVLCASVAFGQAGAIGVFSDMNGTDCNLWDNVTNVCLYHVVYINHGGAQAVQFAAPKPPCHMGIWLSDIYYSPIILGDSQTGVVIGFGGCYLAPTLVLTMQYLCLGTTGSCCTYRVIPDPAAASGLIEAVDCNNVTVYPAGNCAVVNPDASCPCWATPVEGSTWGGIKALYR